MRDDERVNGEREFDIAIVGTVGLPARYGGFETLAEQLVRRLAGRRRMLVYCTAKNRVAFPVSEEGATLEYITLDANGMQSIVYDAIAMWRTTRRSSTMLVLGVSGCLALPAIRWRDPMLRIVTNIDGLEWKRAKWGRLARIILRWSEAAAVRFSDVVIADNEEIRAYVQKRYDKDVPMIAYGGDADATPLAFARQFALPFAARTYDFVVCRIEPENNIGLILEAFARVSDKNLVIVGNWNVSAYAMNLRQQYDEHANIALLDPIYDRAELDAMRRDARALIHGHSAGGTNPSLVEAMSAGMAVLAFDVGYNRYTTFNAARYWYDVISLRALITSLNDTELAANRTAMRALADSHYTWGRIATEYETALCGEPRTSHENAA